MGNAMAGNPVLVVPEGLQKSLNLPVSSSYQVVGFDNLGFAFKKGSKLRDDFDKYLNELGPEKIKAILDKWMK